MSAKQPAAKLHRLDRAWLRRHEACPSGVQRVLPYKSLHHAWTRATDNDVRFMRWALNTLGMRRFCTCTENSIGNNCPFLADDAKTIRRLVGKNPFPTRDCK